MDLEADRYFENFHDEGEEAVRLHLATGRYNDKKRAYAQAWIDSKDRASAARAILEQTEIARSSRNASWFAVGVSVVSAIIALVALFGGSNGP